MGKAIKWSNEEHAIIVGVAHRIVLNQISYYQACKELNRGELSHRTWEAVRQKLRNAVEFLGKPKLNQPGSEPRLPNGMWIPKKR